MTYREVMRVVLLRTGCSPEEAEARMAYSDSVMPDAVPHSNQELVFLEGRTAEDLIEALVAVRVKYDQRRN